MPDSLRTAFETGTGRLVYDGGGIKPDILVKSQKLAPISVSLIVKSLIFDYATQYYYAHPDAPASKEFALSDAEYAKFITWIKDKDYDYVTEVEQTIDDLTEISKDEQYYDAIRDQIASLRQQVQHDKESDLTKYRDEIRELLEEDIVSRYHLAEGKIEASFDKTIR